MISYSIFRRTFFVLGLLFLAIAACNLPIGADSGHDLTTPAPTLTPIPTAQDIPTPTISSDIVSAPRSATVLPAGSWFLESDTPWEEILPGFEVRYMAIPTVRGGVAARVVRIDPSVFTFRVHNRPTDPASMSQWRSVYPEAVLIINGGFFTPEYEPLGVIIDEDGSAGAPFAGHGGIFAVAGESISVRPNAEVSFLELESLTYAVQGRPSLVEYGLEAPFTFAYNSEPSRRTAIGQDAEGRIVMLVVDYGAVTLTGLRAWAAAIEDPELVTAFNLDGGGSSGMTINFSSHQELIDSWYSVPNVIAVYFGD
jgi:uncharacterized protein YigE (DUF2233 family)